MKIKVPLTNKILNMYDQPIFRDEQETQQLTMKDIMMEAVLTPDKNPQDPNSKDIKPEEKYEKYEIFKKIRGCKTYVELTLEEATTIKRIIGETKGQLFMGQAWDIIESGDKLPDPDDEEDTKPKRTSKK